MAKKGVVDNDIIIRFIAKKLRSSIDYGEQQAVADSLGLQKSNLNTYLSAKGYVSLDKLEDIALRGIKMSKNQFNEILIDARVHEFKESTGRELGESDIDGVFENTFNISDPKKKQEAIDYLNYLSRKK